MNPDLIPALMVVFQHVRAHIWSELDCQRLDLTSPDVHVLKLTDKQCGLSLQDLRRQACRDKALITWKIREPEGRDLVRRERNPSDQRSFQLFLIDGGLAIHQHAEAIMLHVHDKLFAPFTPEEQAALVYFLDQCLAVQPFEDIQEHSFRSIMEDASDR